MSSRRARPSVKIRQPMRRAAPQQQSKGVQGFSPEPPNGEPPPSKTAWASEPASSSATPPVSPMALANPPSFAANDPVAPADAKARPARDGHSAHTRPASQHSRPRSVHNVPRLTPPQSPFAETLIPLQPSSFGQTKPVRHALTPPQAEQPDPKRDKCRPISLSQRRSRAFKKSTKFQAVQFLSDLMIGLGRVLTM
jgi:hypothetical protein